MAKAAPEVIERKRKTMDSFKNYLNRVCLVQHLKEPIRPRIMPVVSTGKENKTPQTIHSKIPCGLV